MRFFLRGEDQHPGRTEEIGIYGPVCAVRCDAIQFSMRDIANMHRILADGSETERAKLREMMSHWLCRFVPGAV